MTSSRRRPASNRPRSSPGGPSAAAAGRPSPRERGLRLDLGALAFSVTCTYPWPEAELRAVGDLLPGVPCLVGGRSAVGLRPLARPLGFDLLASLDDLRKRLAELGAEKRAD